jgi:hypothetical protein
MLTFWVWLNWPKKANFSFWQWYRSIARGSSLSGAFFWDETRQGFDFWIKIARRYGLDW